MALIKVGAATEVEMKEKKARVEDALHATRAAVEEGIVAGGGVALIRAKQAIRDIKGDNDEQNAGIRIVLRAMEEPLRQIVANAGDEPSVVVNTVAQGEGNFGYNAQTGEYGDLVEMGVLDPDEGLPAPPFRTPLPLRPSSSRRTAWSPTFRRMQGSRRPPAWKAWAACPA